MTSGRKLSRRERDENPEAHLVPGRECGSCNACCISLTIDDEGLQKPQGYRCPHAADDNSCTIYQARPQSCRSFFCGWRLLKWVREPMRPDRSHVLIQLQREKPRGSFGVVIQMLDSSALQAEGLLETVAAAVAAGIPTYMQEPGPPGYTAARAQINDALIEPVMARDRLAVRSALSHAYAQGRRGGHKPIVLVGRSGK